MNPPGAQRQCAAEIIRVGDQGFLTADHAALGIAFCINFAGAVIDDGAIGRNKLGVEILAPQLRPPYDSVKKRNRDRNPHPTIGDDSRNRGVGIRHLELKIPDLFIGDAGVLVELHGKGRRRIVGHPGSLRYRGKCVYLSPTIIVVLGVAVDEGAGIAPGYGGFGYNRLYLGRG